MDVNRTTELVGQPEVGRTEDKKKDMEKMNDLGDMQLLFHGL